MVSNEVLGLLLSVSELKDRLRAVVVREMKRTGYRGVTEEELMIALRSMREGTFGKRSGKSGSRGVSGADEIEDLGDYMVWSLSDEAGESEGFDGLLMSYEILRELSLTDRMYVTSGRSVATDRVYVDYMLDTFKGKLSIEQGETLGVMLESYLRRVREDAMSRV